MRIIPLEVKSKSQANIMVNGKPMMAATAMRVRKVMVAISGKSTAPGSTVIPAGVKA